MADDVGAFLSRAPHAVSEADRAAVLACIDKDEITTRPDTGQHPVAVALQIEAAQFV